MGLHYGMGDGATFKPFGLVTGIRVPEGPGGSK